MIRVYSCINNPPLPELKAIDHIAQYYYLGIIILRWFIFLQWIIGPFNYIVHYSSRIHFDIIFIPIVDDGLLESCSVGSSFAKLLD